MVNVSVATNESWKDRETGEAQERTEWHRIVMFGKLGEIAQQYLKKGSQAYFRRPYQDQQVAGRDGNDRYSTQIVANEMQMLGRKADSERAGIGDNFTVIIGTRILGWVQVKYRLLNGLIY